MRLIDADRLRNIAISNRDVEMVYEIDHSPTVERPRGEWIDESKDALKCSVCGKWVYKPFIGGFPTERTQHYNPNYCAFCGADMREGESN